MDTEGKPRIEVIHTAKNDPSYNLPYAPAIVVNGGRMLFTAAVAAPTYHHHPHRPEEFDHLPEDTAEQARLTMEQLKEILEAAGGSLSDVVFVTRYIKDVAANQDAAQPMPAHLMQEGCQQVSPRGNDRQGEDVDRSTSLGQIFHGVLSYPNTKFPNLLERLV